MNNNLIWHQTAIDKNQRSKNKNQKSCIIWLTGLSCSGKSTIANLLEKELFKRNCHTYLLDGDNLRFGLNKDLGFDNISRDENIRRVGEVAKLFVDAGIIVICSFISPFNKQREWIRTLVETNEFIEIFVDTSLEICESRDTKGFYKKARLGEIKDFTGIDSPYEKPLNPEIRLSSDKSLEFNIETILDFLGKRKYF
jgi:adenylylsulfate kinase